jgi:NAD(P)-dependent dehydrogenase (short-subunit alcohol dehydrogenase family)
VPVAVVTGASRGIGRATALALAGSGFDLGLVARSADALAETEALVGRRGARAVSVPADVIDPQAAHTAVAEIEERIGPVTVLVNNAGSLRALGPLWEVDRDDWWLDVNTSLGGAFNFCREVVPRMIGRREGRIVNITSYVAVRPTPYQTGYACGKAAVASLTEALAASLADLGIRAFAVAPGFTRTEMTEHLTESAAGRRWLPEVGKGRVVEAEESARLISLLAAGAADELNGRLLHALDDVEQLLERIDEIRRDELYAPRLRRLPDA